jgi:indole-3-acetate monooxygenase
MNSTNLGVPVLKLNDLPSQSRTGIDRDWVAQARSLTAALNVAGPTIDANRGLPSDILDALFEGQLFRMLLPRSQGGAELDLPTFFQVILALAEGDASAAWTVAQSNGCAMSAAYMEPTAASEMFAEPKAVLSWGFPAGPCKAVAVDGGWKVSGTWGFGSGSRHSTWVGGHCAIFDADGIAQKKPDGSPMERTALFPRSEITIVDGQWNVIGLRGTGSDTYSVTDLFVPSKYCVVPRAVGRDLQQAEAAVITEEIERREHSPLFKFSPTMIYQAGFAAVALGIARAMLKSFIDLASKKPPAGGTMMLRDNAVIQERVAISQARLDAMTAWLEKSIQESWDGCVATGQHSYEHRVTMRLASTYTIREATKVAEDIYADAGATAIFAVHPFERRFRDMHAVSQQIQSNAQHLQTAGQHYLGMTPSTRFI